MNINNSLRARRLNEYKTGNRPKVLGIVLHDTCGSGTVGDAKYLANDPEKRGVSADYVILRDGEIFKLNPDLTRYTTNHAGRKTRFKGLLNAQVNGGTIGIELAHKSNPALQQPLWPTSQIQAVADLCQDLCAKFDLRKEDITTHSRIITDGSRSDPREFPWALFWQMFELSGDAPSEVLAYPLITGPVTHLVQKGDTLYALANRYQTTIEKIKALNDMDISNVIVEGQIVKVKEK